MKFNNASPMDTVALSPKDILVLRMTTEVHTAKNVDFVLAEWRELERRLSSQSVASSADWTEAWLKQYGDTVRFHFLVAKANEQTRGIVLIVESQNQKRGPFQLKTVHVGTAGEVESESVCVEYNRILAEDDFRPTFESAISNHLQNTLKNDELRFDGFTTDELPVNSEQYSKLTITENESRFFDLAEARNENSDVISKLGKSTRANIRRRMREIERSFGEIKIDWSTDLNRADNILQELIELHQARWQAIGEPGAFASERFRNFQQEIIARLLPQQRLFLTRISAGKETLGCLLLLVDNNRLLVYVSGLADFERVPCPGLISHYVCMEEALARGFDAYDFLIGENRYKENLGKSSQQIAWASLKRPSMKNFAIEGLRSLKKGLKK